jgi:hypothetical protein
MFNLEKYHFREAAITTAALGALAAGTQMYMGAKAKKEGQKALQDYNRQDLTESNPYEAIPISTVGSDIIREETQRTSANAVDAIRNMGPRGAALLPGVIGANNNSNREARNYLDDQVTKRNYAIAGDNATTRGLMEDRENADLAGIGNEIQVGRQDMWSGFRGLANSAMYAMNNYTPSANPQVEPIESSIKPIGLNPINSDVAIKNPILDYSKIQTGFKPAGIVPYRSPLPTASPIDYSKLYKTGF